MAVKLAPCALVAMCVACHGSPVGEVATDSGGGTAGADAASGGASGGGAGGADAQVDLVRVLASGRDCPVDLRVAAGSVIWVDEGSPQNSTHDGVVASMPANGCSGDAGSCITTLAENQWSPSAVEIDLLTNTVYWATYVEGTIWQLPAGTSTPLPFAESQNGPRWLAVDDVALYWTNLASGTNGEVRRKYLDGGAAGGLPIVQGLESPLAISVFDMSIYFTNDGHSDLTGYVVSADVTGAGTNTVADLQSHPRGIAVDAAHVYWTNLGDGSILLANHDGSGFQRLLSGRANPSDIAVDDKGIYWVEAGTPNEYSDGAVYAAKLDGTGVVTLASGQRDPRRIALDADHVYFIDRGSQGLQPCTQHDGSIRRVPKPW